MAFVMVEFGKDMRQPQISYVDKDQDGLHAHLSSYDRQCFVYVEHTVGKYARPMNSLLCDGHVGYIYQTESRNKSPDEAPLRPQLQSCCKKLVLQDSACSDSLNFLA